MFNLYALELAIGMASLYMLLSLLCAAAAEVIAGLLGLRAKNLEAGLRSLFSDGFGPGGDASIKQIYEQGLVRGLSSRSQRHGRPDRPLCPHEEKR
jgi:hypothetical protein